MTDDDQIYGDLTARHPDFEQLIAGRQATAPTEDIGDLTARHPDFQKLVAEKQAAPTLPQVGERSVQAARGIEPRSLTSYADDPTTSWTR